MFLLILFRDKSSHLNVKSSNNALFTCGFLIESQVNLCFLLSLWTELSLKETTDTR